MGDLRSSNGSNSSIPEFIAGLYYRYGLFVATHPLKVILFAIATSISICTPLLYLPLPGFVPQEHVNLLDNYSIPDPGTPVGIQLGLSTPIIPLWYQDAPKAYIQQVVVRATVTPWEDGVTLAESIRGPLFSVFHLSQLISDFHMKENHGTSLVSECLLVEEVVRKMRDSGPSLPHYNCMMLSPADLWGRNPQAFVKDPNVLSTINSLQTHHEGETSVGDILFGLPAKDVGIEAKPNHPQIISYAVTIVLRRYSEKFICALEKELTERLSVNQPMAPPRTYMQHIYFPSRLSLWEFLTIGLYMFLFLSMYFSVLKLKGLYSKLGLAFSVLVTLLVSLGISVSISAHFGWRPLHSHWNFFYPMLSGLVGFENSMALVRAILSTPDHLDIKIRVAQGLSREGWIITKYFVTMITTLTLSFFLFIPGVQEVCINGSLVLLCDLYMQLIFLTAVISIDLRRYQNDGNHKESEVVNPLFKGIQRAVNQKGGPSEHPSVPNLHRRHKVTTSCGQECLAPPQTKPQAAEIMPRRLRLTFFLAKKRLVQRMAICGFVTWVAWLLYSDDIFDSIYEKLTQTRQFNDLSLQIFSLTNKSFSSHSSTKSKLVSPTIDFRNTNLASNYIEILKHKHRSFARRLLPTHWPSMFDFYNITLRGKYITILPPITLSVPVSYEEAKISSNTHDPLTEKWKPDLPTERDESGQDETEWDSESVFVPSSNGELVVTALLLIPAVAFMIYAMVTLYRIICSRNYAEWRSSWRGKDGKYPEVSSQIIGETVPLVLSGHPHDVECLSTDGSVIVSSCLAGTIYVWDPGTGESIGTINRTFPNKVPLNGLRRGSSNQAFASEQPTDEYETERYGSIAEKEGNIFDLPSSQSFPSLSSLPDLTSTIDVDFSLENLSQNHSFSGSRFDHIQQLYAESQIYNRTHSPPTRNPSPDYAFNRFGRQHTRHLSAGSITFTPADNLRRKPSEACVPQPIWCMDCQDGLVFVGTGTGVLEVWDVFSCKVKCIHDDGSGIGITSLKVSGNTVVAARLVGSVDVLQLEPASGHNPADSAGWTFDLEEPLNLFRRALVRAHQQPITVLTCDSSRIITGSLDHTLRILSIHDGSRLFTLLGHYGPVTTVALGKSSEMDCKNRDGFIVDLAGVDSVVASGAQDGSLCVWDIYSGMCVYSVQAHDGTVVNLACTSSYILSLGQDDRLCVWERFQGHLLNTLVMSQMYCTSMVMLTNRLLITGRQGSLTVWDITSGVPVRVVRLGDNDSSTFIHNLLPVSGSIVCDYGNQLRVVRLPVSEKVD